MAVNPDPRPGRWMLPLVVLAMVVFAYVFVQSLPGADADATDLGADSTVPSTTTTTIPLDETTTTTVPVDPEVAAYLETLGQLESQLTGFQTEMATINTQWDNREIEFADGEAALLDLSGRVAAWADGVATVTPPVQLASTHEIVVQASAAAAQAAADVLEGFRGPTAEPRIEALQRFDDAVLAFTAAVDDAALQAGTGA